MNIIYTVTLEAGDRRSFRIPFEQQVAAQAPTSLPDWARLSHCQCSNCPLDTREVSHCPAAVSMLPVVESFKSEDAYRKVTAEVDDGRRSYRRETTLEETLRSLLGVVMATSDCPILTKLRPMARHHLPFASSDEFIMRTVSVYLVQQLFEFRRSSAPDWDLKGLVAINQSLQLVNQALWQRIHAACTGDSVLKALLNFFSMASSVSVSLESQLRKLELKLTGQPPQ